MLGRRRARANQQYAAAATNDAGAAGAVPAGSLAGGGSNYVQQPQYVDQNGQPLGARNNYSAQKAGYAGNGAYNTPTGQEYVDPAYGGGGGVPIDGRQRRHDNKFANTCAALFACCWCCTWPCHGPCCCGL